MSLTIDLAGADAYFAPRNHLKAEDWKDYHQDLRAAAIAQALRRVSRELGSEVTEEAVDAATYYHPDWAVYEEALYLLENSMAIANAEQTAPHYRAVDPFQTDTTRKQQGTGELSPEASRYLLRPRRRIFLVRG